MSDSVYGPQVKRPLRIRMLQAFSLLLAVAGLLLLYLYSVNRDIPTVRVAEITPVMNFAYVKVSGKVTRSTHLFKSGGMVFNLHDGSGEIAVFGGRTQAEALEKSGKLPRRGDRVEVAGSLGVSADREVKLRMQSADQLILRRKRAARTHLLPRISLSKVTPEQKGDTVSVIGTLKAITLPRPGSKAPYVLTLEEKGTELVVIFWDNVFQELEQKLPILGKTLHVCGRVDLYKGTLQLKILNAADLREVDEQQVPNVVPATPAHRADFSERVVRIADLTADRAGEVFTLIGTLGEPRAVPGGVIYPITDDSGEMVVVFWDKQVSGEERDALESGIRLRVTAPLDIYKGTLELIPKDAGAFRIEPQ